MAAEAEVPATTPPVSVPPAPAKPLERAPRRSRARPIIISLFLLGAIAVAGYFGYNYWRDAQLYISTDDALVDATMQAITAPGSGTLLTWRAQAGQQVQAGAVVGVVRTTAGLASVSSFNVVAPIDGTLIRVDAREGQAVAPTLPLAYVADLAHLRVTAFVDETEISDVHIGQPVDVTVDATGKTSYTGSVSEIIPSTASQFALLPSTDRSTANFTKVTQRVEVHIVLDNANSVQLFPGENANVRIHR